MEWLLAKVFIAIRAKSIWMTLILLIANESNSEELYANLEFYGHHQEALNYLGEKCQLLNSEWNNNRRIPFQDFKKTKSFRKRQQAPWKLVISATSQLKEHLHPGLTQRPQKTSAALLIS